MIKQITDILKGIDKDTCQDEHGWWETSKGAKFGAEKLEEIKDLIRVLNSQGGNSKDENTSI